MTTLPPLEIIAWLAAGTVFGLVYFQALRYTVGMIVRQVSAPLIVGIWLARIGIAVAVFWLIATQGAAPLLLALAGFIAARFAVQRLVGAH